VQGLIYVVCRSKLAHIERDGGNNRVERGNAFRIKLGARKGEEGFCSVGHIGNMLVVAIRVYSASLTYPGWASYYSAIVRGCPHVERHALTLALPDDRAQARRVSSDCMARTSALKPSV
jgi:hypothetical protein